MSQTIVLTGATGLLGTRIHHALTARGDEVILFVRNPIRARERFPETRRLLLWAPGVAGEWQEALGEADAIVHLAGESLGARRWNAAVRHAILSSRADGTRELAEAAAAARCRNAAETASQTEAPSQAPAAAQGHIAAQAPAASQGDAASQGQNLAVMRPMTFISASGIGFYGDTGEREVDERSDAGSDFIADVCRAWEDAAAPAAEAGIRTVALRMGVVFAREAEALRRIAQPFRFGVGGALGSGRQYFPWIHVEDAVGLFLHALDSPGLTGPVNAVAPERVRNADLARTIGRVLRRPALFPVPSFMLRLVVGEFADALLTGQNALPARALASGYRFRHPELLEALRDCLA